MTTVTLKYPVEHNGKTVSELTFRRATFGDFCKADGVTGENSQYAALFASMADTTIQVIKALDMEDMAAVLEAAGPLAGNGRQPTAGQSPE